MKAFIHIVVVLLLALSANAFTRELHKPAHIGHLTSRGDSRIIDGYPAVNGQFPWHAFVLTTEVIGVRIGCGGSLISPSWVMTAAHCSRRGSSLIFLGDVQYSDSPVRIESQGLYPHPDFNELNFNNDIGLIALPDPVVETATIRPIQFYRDISTTFEGLMGNISGFGVIANSTEMSQSLLFASVNVISNEECANFYGNSVVIPSSLCTVGAFTSNQGPCSGDSGGALVRDIGGETVQIGIISFGSSHGCLYPVPNGYVRTSHYVDWIHSVTGL